MSHATEETAAERIISIRMPEELVNKADDAGKKLNLKRADVIRLALGR